MQTIWAIFCKYFLVCDYLPIVDPVCFTCHLQKPRDIDLFLPKTYFPPSSYDCSLGLHINNGPLDYFSFSTVFSFILHSFFPWKSKGRGGNEIEGGGWGDATNEGDFAFRKKVIF